MLTKSTKYIAVAIALATALAGCSTKQKIQKPSTSTVGLSEKELVQRIAQYNPNEKQIRGSMEANIKPNSLNISSHIDVAVLSGESIRIAATPFPLFEAGRIWLDTKGATVAISALKKRSEISWKELSSLINIGMNYPVCEAIIEARVFTSLSQKGNDISLKNCKVSEKGKLTEISFSESGLDIRFGINNFGRPEYLIVSDKSAPKESYSRIDYKEYKETEVGLMPMLIKGSFFDGKKIEELFSLEVNRWKKGNLSNGEFVPKVKQNYTFVSPTKLFELVKRL